MNLPRVRRFIPLATLVLTLLVVGLLPVSLSVSDTVIPQSNGLLPVGEIAAGVTVTEQFPATTTVAAISLLLATYQRVNEGTLRITLLAETDGRWQERAVRDVDMTTVRNDAYHTLVFSPPLPIKRGQRVRITLQSDGQPGASVTWLSNPAERRQDYILTVNGRVLPGTAVFQVSYVPESGLLFLMVGEIWSRSTIFLNGVWQAILILGLAALAGSVLALTRRLDE